MTTTSETLPPAEGAMNETATFDGATRTRRLPRFRVLFVAFIAALVVALVASGAGLYAYDHLHDGQILHGVRIGGIDVSDLDRDAAAARLRAGLAALGQGAVVVNDGVVKQSLSFATLGRGPAIDALLDQAFAVGRTGTIVDRGVDEVRTATRGMGIAPSVAVDASAVATAVASLATTEDRTAVDAAAIATSTGFKVLPGRVGRTVDQAAMTAAIVAALSKTDVAPQIDLELISTATSPAIDDATATLAANQAATIARDITITGAKQSSKITGATIRSWITFAPLDGHYGPLVDTTNIAAALKPLIKDVARKPKDATFLISKSGKIVGVTAGTVGRTLDVNGTVAAVATALQARASGVAPNTAVAAVLTSNDPKLTTAVAQKSAPLMRQISTWVTYYAPGAHNGNSANITIPAQAISGTVVAPGAKFSFWASVGEVSLAKGYKLGGAIINGHSVEGKTIGGGICSTSTTLFNAALRAGFLMGSRKNHYYYIARYPKGLDATVFISGSVQDMTWTNNSPYPVLIKAFTRPGMVRFTLYSVPTGRKVSISRAVVKNYRPTTTVYQTSSSLPHGVVEQVEYPAAGFDSWVTVTVRDKSGKVINVRTYYSHYARVVGLYVRGL
jgi:vancomycin resistance protein YoaR